MLKLTTLIAIAIVLTGTFFDTGSPVEASSNLVSFGDTCRNVKFKVVNRHTQGGDIKLMKVEYYNKANGKWQSEDIPNAIIRQGKEHTTGGQDLRDSEGEQITKIKFVYQWKGKGRGSNWSDNVTSKVFEPSAPTCNANRTYGNNSWVIGN